MLKSPLLSVGLGALVWFAFLVFIRLLGPTVFDPGSPLLLALFAAAIPILVLTIFVLSRVTRTPVREMPMPVVIMTCTALLLDGLAVGFTGLYGDTPQQIAASAAFLLWGGGVGMICSLLLARREGSVS